MINKKVLLLAMSMSFTAAAGAPMPPKEKACKTDADCGAAQTCVENKCKDAPRPPSHYPPPNT